MPGRKPYEAPAITDYSAGVQRALTFLFERPQAMPAPARHRECIHVQRGERAVAALASVVTMPAWDGDPLHDRDGLCVVCTARVLSLLMALEKGDAVDA